MLQHGILCMRIRVLISDNTSEVPANIDPPLEAEFYCVTLNEHVR